MCFNEVRGDHYQPYLIELMAIKNYCGMRSFTETAYYLSYYRRIRLMVNDEKYGKYLYHYRMTIELGECVQIMH